MSDFDAGVDATMAAAHSVLAETERLAGEIDAGTRVMGEWQKANALDATVREKFFAALSEEDREKVRKENEEFERQLALDMDDVRPPEKQNSPAKRKNRSMA